MVDALRRAHRWLRVGGLLIDVHPTAAAATLEVGGEILGRVDTFDGPTRHAAANAALTAVVGAGLFVVERAVDFDFFTYGDSVEELRDYVADNWCEASIAPAAVARASRAVRAAPGAKPTLREIVRASKLTMVPASAA